MSDKKRKAYLKRYHNIAVARQQRARKLHTFTLAYRCKQRREQQARRKTADAELDNLTKNFTTLLK